MNHLGEEEIRIDEDQMVFYRRQVAEMADRSKRAAQEMRIERRTNSGTPRSQDISLEVDS
eukprot:12864998-Prorocentrum_lima.AAC.1